LLIADLGWVGFDAANGQCPTDHYVRLAAGLDARAVAPVKGSRRGLHGSEVLTVAVTAEIAQQ
jgi:transglutaminase-like putative cysteine protease